MARSSEPGALLAVLLAVIGSAVEPVAHPDAAKFFFLSELLVAAFLRESAATLLHIRSPWSEQSSAAETQATPSATVSLIRFLVFMFSPSSFYSECLPLLKYRCTDPLMSWRATQTAGSGWPES